MTGETLRQKVTTLVAMELFATSAAALKPGLHVDWFQWLEQEKAVQDSWRTAAAPVVDKLLGILLSDLKGGIDRAAEALWRASAAGFASMDTWDKVSPEARESFRFKVKAALTAWLEPGVLARLDDREVNT